MKKLLCCVLLLTVLGTLFCLPTAATEDMIEDPAGEVVEDTPLDTDLLTCVGVSARVDGESNALRTLYSIDLAKALLLEGAGYAVEVGALIGIAEYRGEAFHTLEDLTVEAIESNTPQMSAITVYATDPAVGATYTYVSYTEGESATFALTVDFGDDADVADADRDKYLIRFVYRGFVILTDPDGVKTTLYADPSGEYRNGTTLNEVARTLVADGEYAENAGFTAIIEKVGYRVIFRYKNPATGRFEIVDTQYVLHGGAATPPEEVILPKGYVFAGWREDCGNITEDCFVNAVLKETGSWSPPIQ